MDRKLGYLFERFPAFTQTFCARELAELYRQGISPPVYSIRRPTEARPANIPLENIPIYYLPDTNSLEFKIRTKLIPPRLKDLWSGSGDLRDKGRFREAVVSGAEIKESPGFASSRPFCRLGFPDRMVDQTPFRDHL